MSAIVRQIMALRSSVFGGQPHVLVCPWCLQEACDRSVRTQVSGRVSLTRSSCTEQTPFDSAPRDMGG